jgi:Tfp pilus assembly pilus retraction ATPase PilT
MSMLRRNPQVIWDVVDGVMVLCHTASNAFFELNQTGALVWSMCDESAVEAIVEHLRGAYPHEDRDQVAIDVRNIILALEEARLLEVGSD